MSPCPKIHFHALAWSQVRRRLASFIPALFFICFFASSVSAETLTQENGEIDLLDSVQVFSFEQLLEHDTLRQLLSEEIPPLTVGLPDSLWQKASVEIESGTDLCWLGLGNRGMWENLVVIIVEKVSGRATVLYDIDIYNSGPMLMRAHWIPLEDPNHARSLDIYVSLKLAHKQLPLRQLVVMTDKVKQDQFLFVIPIMYAFFSSLLILLLYNLMLFWSLRSYLHAVYAFYCCSIMFFVGIGFAVFYDASFYRVLHLSLRDIYILSIALLQIAMVSFCYSFLEPEFRSKKVWQFLFGIVLFDVLLALLMLYAPYNVSFIPNVNILNKVLEFTGLILICLFLYTFIQAWRKGSQDALFLFFSQLPPLLMLLSHLIARFTGVSSSSWLTYKPFSLPLAYVLEMFILSYAMTERVRRIRDRSLMAKADAERALQLTLKGQNVELERLVKVRTLELEEAKSISDELARTDPMTGMNNRRAFFEYGDVIAKQAKRYGDDYSIVILDIDHFKKVNDTYGHGVGDGVIKSLAGIIKATIRDVDVPGRIGGEEFAIILPKTTKSVATDVAERLRCNVAAAAVPLDDCDITFTISLGVAESQEGDRLIEDILARADNALYQAKEQGRNKVCVDA